MKNQRLPLHLILAILIFTACKNEKSQTTKVVAEEMISPKGILAHQDTIEKEKTVIADLTKDSTLLKTPKKVSVKKETSLPALQGAKKKRKKKLWPKIQFENLEYDFGEIIQGDTVDFNFKFKNTGQATLEILSAKASCGCTQPSYPFIGLDKNEEGVIGVRYISIGKSGPQVARVTILSNAYTPKVELLLKGIVKPKEKQKID